MSDFSSYLRKIGCGFSVSVLFCAFAFSQSRPFITFDAPGAGTANDQGTIAISISQSGSITGWYMDSNNTVHGFVRAASGVITDFDPPGSLGTFPNAINSHGQIVGQLTRRVGGNDHTLGFFRSANGTVSAINPPSSVDTQPFGINDSGVITGAYDDAAGVWHGFLRSSGGAYTVVDAPGAGTGRTQGTTAVAINVKGEVTGYYVDPLGQRHGFVRDSAGNFTTFDAAGTGTQPVAINASGEVTGVYTDSTTLGHSFLRDASGNLSTIDMPTAIQTFAASINDSGIVVGQVVPPTTFGFVGFVRDASGNFSALLPSGANGATANSINNSGRIVGYWIGGAGPAHGFVK